MTSLKASQWDRILFSFGGTGSSFHLVGQGPLFSSPRLTCHPACGISSATLTASCHFALTWVSRASDSGGRDTFNSVCVRCVDLTRPRHRSNSVVPLPSNDTPLVGKFCWGVLPLPEDSFKSIIGLSVLEQIQTGDQIFGYRIVACQLRSCFKSIIGLSVLEQIQTGDQK